MAFSSFGRHFGACLPGVHSLSECCFRAGPGLGVRCCRGAPRTAGTRGAGGWPGSCCSAKALPCPPPLGRTAQRADVGALRWGGEVTEGHPGCGANLCPLPGSMDKDGPDVHQDLNALKTKFQEMRKAVSAMPGIHLSPEQQQQQLLSLREQVRTKSQLLQKYKSLCMFEIPKE